VEGGFDRIKQSHGCKIKNVDKNVAEKYKFLYYTADRPLWTRPKYVLGRDPPSINNPK